MAKVWVAVALGAGLFGGGAWAQTEGVEAEAPSYERGWGLAAAGAAHFPLSSGVQAELELPFRLRLLGGYGVVPRAFQNAVNDALVSLEAYRTEVGAFVIDSIDTATVRRAGLGIRPFPSSGFYVEAVYSNVVIDGSIPLSQLASPLIRQGSAAVQQEGGLRLKTTLHMIHPQLGWEWSAWRFYLRASLGAAFTAFAQSDLTAVEADGTEHDAAPFDRVVEGYLNAALEKRAHVPTGSFVLGFRFF